MPLLVSFILAADTTSEAPDAAAWRRRQRRFASSWQVKVRSVEPWDGAKMARDGLD